MNSKHRQGMGQLQTPDFVQLGHVCEETTKRKRDKMHYFMHPWKFSNASYKIYSRFTYINLPHSKFV
jgi:hypothetical protein